MKTLLVFTFLINLSLTSCTSLNKSTPTKKVDQIKDTEPKLTKPTVKKTWVEDQIQGERYIEGHWEYVIEENSVWGSK